MLILIALVVLLGVLRHRYVDIKRAQLKVVRRQRLNIVIEDQLRRGGKK